MRQCGAPESQREERLIDQNQKRWPTQQTSVMAQTAEQPTMTRTAIYVELEAIVDLRLFGTGRWLADRETCDALRRRIWQMGLREPVPGTSDTWRATPLGAALKLDLYEVFVGLSDEGEIPLVLLDYRLIDDTLADDIYEQMESVVDAEALLRGYVKRAYFDYHNVTKFLN
jgi:hypothetical protein